ncbi:MAG: phosphoglycolate phosphatase [Gammaproteobacteria bacterium]|nr:phosphoglycolate phosphatase [Gammaproteobacteria bacterium]
MFDLIVFDLDGTLIDTAPEIADSVNAVLRQRGLPPADESNIREWIGHGARELMRHAYAAAAELAAQAVDADTMRGLMRDFVCAHELHCGTRSRVYPGTAATLNTLEHQGYKLAVATNKDGRFAEAVLHAHGLRRHFSPIVAGDTLQVRKPDRRVLEHCAAAHGVPLTRVLLVGDSVVDVATGRAAGIPCWVLPHGYNGGQPIASANPDRILPHIGALIDLLQPSGACSGETRATVD